MTIDDEVRRATTLLEALIQVAGVSQEEIDRRLEVTPGYVERLLTGRLELKLRHILALLRVLEIEPALFFQTLFPEPGPAGGTVQLDELLRRVKQLGVGSEPAPAPNLGIEDLERLVQGAVRGALSRPKPDD